MSPLQEFLARNNGLVAMLGRVVGNCLGLLLCMRLAVAYFADTYAANVCLFLVFSLLFEGLSGVTSSDSPVRRLVYVTCLLALAACSVFLFLQATGVRP